MNQSDTFNNLDSSLKPIVCELLACVALLVLLLFLNIVKLVHKLLLRKLNLGSTPTSVDASPVPYLQSINNLDRAYRHV